jgi:hypothetical protein
VRLETGAPPGAERRDSALALVEPGFFAHGRPGSFFLIRFLFHCVFYLAALEKGGPPFEQNSTILRFDSAFRAGDSRRLWGKSGNAELFCSATPGKGNNPGYYYFHHGLRASGRSDTGI